MKAKVIKTGEIINVVPMNIGWGAELINGVRHFEDSELDFNFEYWSFFRREAAKDILAGMLSHQRILYDESLRPEHVQMAISYADELIKQLKEEKNERSVAYER